MSSPAVIIADAVLAKIDEADLSLTYTSSRVHVPKFALDSTGVYVKVVPFSDTRQASTHGTDTADIIIHVGVYKRLSDSVAGEADEVDALLDFCEEIRAVLNRTTITLDGIVGTSSTTCVLIEQAPIYSISELDEKRTFLSVLACSFVVNLAV